MNYAILVEYKYYRGAALAWNLVDACNKAMELSGEWNGCVFSVYYPDGRDTLYIDADEISEPSLSKEEAKKYNIEVANSWLKADNHGLYERDYPGDEIIERYKEIVKDGPNEKEINSVIQNVKRKFISAEALTAWEEVNLKGK